MSAEHSWSLLSSLPAHLALVCPSDPTGRLPALPVGRQSRGVRAGWLRGAGCCLTREQRGTALLDRGDVGGCCRIGGSVAQLRGTRAGSCQLGVQGYASLGASGMRVEGSNAGRSSGCSLTWMPQAPRSSGAGCCYLGGQGAACSGSRVLPSQGAACCPTRTAQPKGQSLAAPDEGRCTRCTPAARSRHRDARGRTGKPQRGAHTVPGEWVAGRSGAAPVPADARRGGRTGRQRCRTWVMSRSAPVFSSSLKMMSGL